MLKSPWELPASVRPRLARCTGGTDASEGRVKYFHFRPDLQPVSKFDVDALKVDWEALADFGLDAVDEGLERRRIFGVPPDEEDLGATLDAYPPSHTGRRASAEAIQASSDEIARLYYATNTKPMATPIQDPANIGNYSLPFIFVAADRLDNELFDQLWARGEPIIVDGVGGSMTHMWTPDTFIERFGSEPCRESRCQGEASCGD